ncbi:GNAT family N-acetyltransferase [Palleronia sp. LCG004]|uniref:GNAT family N-acetyltransferase n=1 Tax=Palleronia sp. LCG004 TaxID=3079304 RepID=UPI0029431263|nr:GNAT family N-acetyltransferase [Palleronia sp. LCG004]WOI55577.1 GNAT family N-acetyltransferase [Palleronia sp. LCG004]
MTADIGVTEDIALCHALRRAVFIEEQRIAEAEEWDDLDGEAVHLLASLDGVPVGTARLLSLGKTMRIGRICVLHAHRGKGIGRQLVEHALDVARDRGMSDAALGAQVHALDFYRTLGFVAEGEVYDDAGIPHREMTRPL